MNIPEKGSLLIAEPFMKDTNFQRSVVLVCQKQEDGFVGFTINQKIDHMVGDLVEDLSSCTLPLYDGGPVGKEQMFFLHCMPEIIPGGIHINAGIYWGGDFDKIKELVLTNSIDENKIRFIVGYSGWEGGQLEEEIKEKSWLCAPSNQELVFHTESTLIWKNAVKLLGDEFKQIINYPLDPSLN
jgi:putative transcriptional regulator